MIIGLIKAVVFKIALFICQRIYIPLRSSRIRKKNTITVAFVLSDLAKWKTESLYKRMKDHPRFNPVIFVIPFLKYANADATLEKLKDYLREKGYDYYLPDNNQKISDFLVPDILFYQQPYRNRINRNKEYWHNLRSLFCYVSYASHTNDSTWYLDRPMLNLAWQVYFENELVKDLAAKVMTNKGINCCVTGFALADLFLSDKIENPWKKQDKQKVKIIWAPHHTFRDYDHFNSSTFMLYQEYMLSLAAKYKDDIQIAFKPHPVLLSKLYDRWGKEKTDEYYSLWDKGENTQLIMGDYVSLFMSSDAMIHDCCSFTVEYHYSRKPVMFLVRDENLPDEFNFFWKMAYDLHYKGRCEQDIDSFVRNVIAGKDELREAREKYFNDYLLPPYGNTVADNIINAILGC